MRNFLMSLMVAGPECRHRSRPGRVRSGRHLGTRGYRCECTGQRQYGTGLLGASRIGVGSRVGRIGCRRTDRAGDGQFVEDQLG